MNNHTKQLTLEIDLLLLHLEVPAEESTQEQIASHQKELISLRKNLEKLGPEAALSMLNDLLKTMKFKHQVKWLTDKNAKEYVKNDPLVYKLFTLVILFVCCPLKVEINIDQIQKNKEAIIEAINRPSLSVAEGLQVMEWCRATIEEISQIIDRYETAAGRRPKKGTALPK